MSSLGQMFERLATNGEELPVVSTSLLAAADEFSHYLGIVDDALPTSSSQSLLHCFTREKKDPTVERVFQILEEDRTARQGWILGLNEKAGFFKQLKWRASRLDQFCVSVPNLQVYSEPARGDESSIGVPSTRFAEPKYVLAMILIDLELGRLINTLRSIRFRGASGHRFNSTWGNGIVRYIQQGRAESSLFENTLFFLFGDHGMVDGKHMMAPGDAGSGNPRRHLVSINTDLIQVLNTRLGLVTSEAGGQASGALSREVKFGIDNKRLPVQIAVPHRDESWQGAWGVLELTREAQAWSNTFFDELQEALKAELSQKYWWLFFLKQFLFDPRFDRATEKYRPTVVDQVARLYLRAVPRYQAAEGRARQAFFDRHVRLVYGGGARNNAELFLPSMIEAEADQGAPQASWISRPSYQQIMEYRGGENRGERQTTLIEALKDIPAVGLIFVRKKNLRVFDLQLTFHSFSFFLCISLKTGYF